MAGRARPERTGATGREAKDPERDEAHSPSVGQDRDLDDYEIVSSAAGRDDSAESALSSTASSRAASEGVPAEGSHASPLDKPLVATGDVGKRKRDKSSPIEVPVKRGNSSSDRDNRENEQVSTRRGRRGAQKLRR